MKSLYLHQGDEILTIDDNELRKGTIEKFYTQVVPPVLLVKFENGDFEKVSIDKIATVPKNEKLQSYDEENEKLRKNQITITADEFSDICSRMISEKNDKLSELVITAFSIFCTTLHEELFN